MSDDRPNVVLVTVDSLRADHCGFMGYEKDTTPTLDAMAEGGFVFENAVAPGPATPESMPATFTGLRPVDIAGAEDPAADSNGDVDLQARRERIRAHMDARETLAERLRRRGYETAAFTPNPFTSRHFGFDAGFDRFEDFMDESNRGGLYERIFDGFLEGSGVSSLARVLLNFAQREEVFKPWESYYDDVLAWADGAEGPYFLWVFLMDAHNPYMASGEYRSQSRLAAFHANVEFWRQSHETPFSESVHEKLVRAYDDAVRYSDAFLERLQSDLAGDDPVIAVHGDHGEAFGEQGTYGHEPHLYPENVHVPLVLSGVESGRHRDAFSLANLPDLLVDVAEGDGVRLDGDGYAVSATRQGGARGFHTSGPDLVDAGYQGEVVDGESLDVEGIETFRSVADSVLARSAQTALERTSAADAARELIEEGSA